MEEARRPRSGARISPLPREAPGQENRPDQATPGPAGGGGVVHGPRPGQKATLAGGKGPSGLCRVAYMVGLCLRLGGLQQPAWPLPCSDHRLQQAACVQVISVNLSLDVG